MADAHPPPGFEPLFRTSPFLDHLGPFFMRRLVDGTFVVGVRIQPHHANGRGVAHGGLLMTLCDIALGTFPALRPKVRLNAVALLDAINHPQARETLHLLLRDENPDVSIRAVRGAARLRDPEAVAALERSLRQPTLPPLVAAETVRALTQIDSPDAQRTLSEYAAADPVAFPHRGSDVVARQLRERRR